MGMGMGIGIGIGMGIGEGRARRGAGEMVRMRVISRERQAGWIETVAKQEQEQEQGYDKEDTIGRLSYVPFTYSSKALLSSSLSSTWDRTG